MKPFLKLLPLVLFPLFLLGIGLFFCTQKPSFGMKNISSDLKPEAIWEIPIPTQIDEVLSQKFSYLAAGSQCYAFVSQDGKYVLKFFRMKSFRPRAWVSYLPPISIFKKIKDEKTKRQRDRLAQLFHSYKLAYDQCKDETGLIYIHLNKGNDLQKTIQLVDKYGKMHLIHLDQMEFILQKRAEVLLYTHLENLWRNGEKDKLEQELNALYSFIAARSLKGIADKDSGLENNYGYSEGKLFQLDPGRLHQNPEIQPNSEILRAQQKLKQWAEERNITFDLFRNSLFSK